jgi:hypothetical protein
MQSKRITEEQLASLASEFGLELALLKAFMKIESRGSGFLKSGKIKLLFERHKFFKYSGSVPVSKTRPDLANPTAGGYAKGITAEARGEKEYQRLQDAIAFHEEGAYKSASYGLLQVMGFNHTAAGHPTAKAMYEGFCESEYKQVKGALKFMESNGILKHLKLKSFTVAARLYNGSACCSNPRIEDNYDYKLERYYKQYV